MTRSGRETFATFAIRAAAIGGLALGGLALGGLAACGPAAHRRTPVESAGMPPLAGIWDVAFVLDAPPLGFEPPPAGGLARARVGGTLALVANHWLTAPVGDDATAAVRPIVYGTYDVDFRAFGFDPRDPDRVPDVIATEVVRRVPVPRAALPRAAGHDRGGPSGGDSVTVVLGPDNERAQVVLVGAARADSVVGTWRLRSAGRWGATAAGRFVLVARH